VTLRDARELHRSRFFLERCASLGTSYAGYFLLVLWFMALYTTVMIKTFRDRDSERLFNREPVKRFREIERAARRKLEMLDAAESMDNLRYPPGNRLEALKGNRRGQHSIRINDQYRVCFVWGDDNNAYDVEISDYH